MTLLQDLLLNNDYNEFKIKLRKLYNNNIYIIEVDNRILLYTNINTACYKCNESELLKECRSVIINKNNLKIICFTYKNIYFNIDAKMYLFDMILAKNDKYTIYEYIEGTFLSIYYDDDGWKISERKNLDFNYEVINENIYKRLPLFLECIDNDFDNFCKNLNKKYIYFFNLVHYKNKNIIDYTKYYNNSTYKKLYLLFMRDKITQKYVEIETNTPFTQLNKFSNFETYDNYIDLNSNDDIVPNIQGSLIKIVDNDDLTLLNIQTNKYEKYIDIYPCKNVYKSLLKLYLNNKLNNNEKIKYYLDFYKNQEEIIFNNKIYNVFDFFDNIIYNQFISELLFLFNYFYDLQNLNFNSSSSISSSNSSSISNHKNTNSYNFLSIEYKIVLYNLRGLHYSNNRLDRSLIFDFLKKCDIDFIEKIIIYREKLYTYDSRKLKNFNIDNNHQFPLTNFELFNYFTDLLKKNKEINDNQVDL